MFRAFAVLRAARLLRGVRLVRIVSTANRSMNALRATLRRRQFGYVAALTLLVLLLGAAGMLSFEPANEVEGGFTSYGHALWWTGMLIASLGTDFWPVSTEGRILSALLPLYGLAVFGYITVTFASLFIGRDATTPRPAWAEQPTLRRSGMKSQRFGRPLSEVAVIRELNGDPISRNNEDQASEFCRSCSRFSSWTTFRRRTATWNRTKQIGKIFVNV